MAECLAQYPHYLAYFNQLAGGPSKGYKHLVDGSLDWGQDLRGLTRWLAEHHLDASGEMPAYLGYFGTASPIYYKVPAKRLPSLRYRPESPTPLTAGVYCLSATYLQQVYEPVWGPWCTSYEKEYQAKAQALQRFLAADPTTQTEMIQSKGKAFWEKTSMRYDRLRLARLCAFLRQREPDDNVGYSILIYRLTAQDIQEALSGCRWLSPTAPDEPIPTAR